jgi:cation diffusion facilitator family transporter
VIGISSLYLIYISIKRIFIGTTIESLNSGIFIMVFSTVVSYVLATHLRKTAEETDSIALSADSLHYRADVYTSSSVIIGLIIIRFSGLVLIDSIISICIALYIIWSSLSVLNESVDILMDKELPKETLEEVKEIILNHKPLVKSFHKMRTRRSGSKRFIEFHLVVDHKLSFVESHDLAEDIIKDIEGKVPNADVTVHVDPHSFPDYS